MQRRNLFTYVGACLAGFLAWIMPKSQAKAEMIHGEVVELKAYERPKLQMRFVYEDINDPTSIGLTILQYKFEDEVEWQSVHIV